ncbi:MAG: universal stress protein [Pseudomonadota bacterium]
MKSIVVAFDGTPAARTALSHAVALAGTSEGHITAVLAHSSSESYASQGPWIPAEVRKILEDANDRAVAEAKTAFEKEAARLDVGDRLTLETIAGRVDDVLARRARASDLLIAPRPTGEAEMHVIQHPDQIALRSGRPLLIVPAGADPLPAPAHVALAWDGKRAAARAMADALPLLPPGSTVTLLTIGDQPLNCAPELVLAHLSRHGFAAEHITRQAKGSVADAIIAYCDQAHPALLVMGAYEHSKFQVELMGGPTVDVLRRANLPVLMSH